jgi:hypothetical protein
MLLLRKCSLTLVLTIVTSIYCQGNVANIFYFSNFDFNSAGIRTRTRKSAFSIKQSISERISSVEKPSVMNKTPRISFSKTSELTTIASNLFRCHPNRTVSECRNKTHEFKNKVIRELTKSMTRSNDENIYNVEYQPIDGNESLSTISMLMSTRVKMLRKKEPPFNTHKLGLLFPKKKLYHKVKGKSCVIVSSAGSMAGSNLGSFIGERTIWYLNSK